MGKMWKVIVFLEDDNKEDYYFSSEKEARKIFNTVKSYGGIRRVVITSCDIPNPNLRKKAL